MGRLPHVGNWQEKHRGAGMSRIRIRIYSYVNVSDQSSIFTHETKMLIWIRWKCFLAFNVLNMTRTDGWIQNFSKKKRRNSPKNTIRLFCTVTHSVLLCYTTIGHFRWVRWDPKWPWASWQWVGITFRAFMGPWGAQIAFNILFSS